MAKSKSKTGGGQKEKKPKSVVLLEAFDQSGNGILKRAIPLDDYYDGENDLVDNSSFRSERKIVNVHGQIYDMKGILVQEFWTVYLEDGEIAGGKIRFKDGEVQDLKI
jgi:hypothetical protein